MRLSLFHSDSNNGNSRSRDDSNDINGSSSNSNSNNIISTKVKRWYLITWAGILYPGRYYHKQRPTVLSGPDDGSTLLGACLAITLPIHYACKTSRR